jgi:hypothetical protein
VRDGATAVLLAALAFAPGPANYGVNPAELPTRPLDFWGLALATGQCLPPADPGCTTSLQSANVGGSPDAILSTLGVVAPSASGFFLAAAMKRTAGRPGWVRPVRRASVAPAGAAGIAALCLAVLHRFREQ